MFDSSLFDNPVLNVDSYKYAHFDYYPSNVRYTQSYVEARGPADATTIFLGPQMFIKRYLSQRITHDHVSQAKELICDHGLPFNEDGFRTIVDAHGGYWPLRIKAVPEGTKVRTSNVLSTVQNTDPRFPWLPSFIETAYLRCIWYPTTVASHGYKLKQILRQYLIETTDLTGEALDAKLNFMLHDFGARGASSKESAEIGGVGHLVNFMGTDTVGALVAARAFYGNHMAGSSIPASEHSVVTSWGRDRELDFYRHQLQTAVRRKSPMFASVIDSYDSAHAVRDLWGTVLKDELKASGATLVLRPDSGDPTVTLPRLLNMAAWAFGFTINAKGYKVLPAYVRFIQGDGITRWSLPGICEAIKAAGFSLENMAMGMGGGGLQQVNRDDYRFAMKTAAAYVGEDDPDDFAATNPTENGQWIDVYKDPIDDPGKRSKRGRLGLYRDATGADHTGPAGQPGDRLETVYDGAKGGLMRDQSFADIRALAA